jgi:hypothetical protein
LKLTVTGVVVGAAMVLGFGVMAVGVGACAWAALLSSNPPTQNSPRGDQRGTWVKPGVVLDGSINQ